MIDNIVEPAVVVAAFGLFLQGLKSGWDLWFAILQRTDSKAASKIVHAHAVMALIDAMPLESGEQASLKKRVVKEIVGNDVLKKYNLDQ